MIDLSQHIQWARSAGRAASSRIRAFLDADEAEAIALLALVEAAAKYRRRRLNCDFQVFAAPAVRGSVIDAHRAVYGHGKFLRTFCAFNLSHEAIGGLETLEARAEAFEVLVMLCEAFTRQAVQILVRRAVLGERVEEVAKATGKARAMVNRTTRRLAAAVREAA